MIFKLTLLLSLSAALFDNAESHKDSVLNIGWLFDMEGRAEKKSSVCETANCKLIAQDFLASMNKSVDPCEDFYEYVCGQWKNEDLIPPWESTWSVFHKYQLLVSERIKGILETKPESNDILPVRQAKKWYRSCMDTEALEKRGLKPIESVLIQVGGWPMIIDAEEWDENDHSWQQIEHYYFDVTGSYTFHKITPASPVSETSDDEWPFPFKRKLSRFLIDTQYAVYIEDYLEEYSEFIERVAKEFTKFNSAHISKKTMAKDIKELIEFEVALYNLEFDDEENTVEEFLNEYDEALEEMGCDDLKKINFQDIINRVFDMINQEVSDKTRIELATPKYYAELTKLLNETPKRTIINYIHWNFVRDMLEYTTEEMRSLKNQLEDTVYEAVEKKPRWLQCTDEMKMVRASSYAFVQKFYTKEIDKEVRDMTENSRKELENLIDKTSWMDEEAKKLSKEKLKKMKIFIGFPEWYKNRTYVINSYKGLLIGSNLFDNILSYRKYEMKKALNNAFDPTEESADPNEEIDPTIVNAFYTPNQNYIELPAANFQPPLFTSQIPRSVNYGMSGTGIGHEMGHGFDVYGINFGDNGTTTQISSKMLSLYYKRAECFLDQYNNYIGVSEPGYASWLRYLFNYQGNSFGARTQGENIADVTGIQAVLEAYLKTLEKEGPDTKLPGFEEYNDKQMFFISFAATWCEAATEEGAEQNLQSDVHSPGRLRVIGSVSNTEAFAKEFNCPKGSPMNPEDKCTIWKNDSGQSLARHSRFRKRKHISKIKN
ncbi:membrane metallo-endopeptidase-like 1 [Cotesia typhae]|uniref:membrane metallo-endopeptidase-like 1 n=1 Tax=Cotesia typhae TaxID=2053667 RepID=UPI003D68B226